MSDDQQPGARLARRRARGPLKWLEPILGLGLFGLALAGLHRALDGHGFREISHTLQSLPPTRVMAAFGLTIVSYFILTVYDTLAVRYAERRLAYRTVAPASFVSSALGHNLGMAALTSVPMRYRFYAAAGLSSAEIARVVFFIGATFGLGIVALGGVALVAEPLAIPSSWIVAPDTLRALGAVLLLATVAYFAVVVLYRKPVRIRTFELKPPTLRLALGQLLVASADLAAAGGVLYVLLPPEAVISFPRFLAVYLLAIIVALISQVPGGLGVFEAVVVATLPVDLPASAVLATLLAYRALYYVIPLLLAGAVLAISEARRHRERLAPVWEGARAWSSTLLPHAAAAVVFLAGAVLLFSGSIPELPGRLRHLGHFVPLPFIEVSHLVGSLVGVCLLFVARGLQRRLDSAYVITFGLLGAGAAASLVKGLDYEEAAILVFVALLLVPMRGVFYRKGALLSERYSLRWFAAIVVVLGAAFWLGFLAFRHVEYSADLWWQFALHADAPRFLRASVAVSVIAATVALTRLVRPVGLRRRASAVADFEKAAAIAARSTRSSANLALLGDKTFLFSAGDNGFVMYGVEGRSWIAMGDPVGPPDTQRELGWAFLGLVDRFSGWPVFYEVGSGNLPLYLDLGLTLLKLGEEAVVSLDAFSLEGRSRKTLRWAQRSVEKAGCSFGVAPPEEVPALLPELRHVSDQWLVSKNTREKGFSLGFFDDAYLGRCPQAIVRQNGAIVAFANVWASAEKEELSIDLMRYSADAPSGVMDYMFIELLLWGKAEGYRRFNLGMAPMSGMESHALAPLWNRAGAFLFRHGEDVYNFQGLRAYKEKFDPVWEPRYLASPAGLALPRILTNLATLISGGFGGILGK